ncbi:MAG: DUF4190 domain-containing protein [Planctomycetota bacterium]
MSENPYAAQPVPAGGTMQSSDFGSSMPSGPARTSVLAILSLLFSLVCFIPGLSTIGSVLGVFAIIGISSSKGRVKGTGLAVAGIVIGLLVTIIWIGLAIGVNQGLQQYATFGSIVADVQDGGEPAVRARLAAETNEAITSADLEAFEAAYRADAGAYTGVPTGIGPLFGSFRDLAESGSAPDNSAIPYGSPIPLPGNFENGSRLMWIALSRTEQNAAGTPAFINFGIELSDGTIAWLIDPASLGAGSSDNAPMLDGSGQGGQDQADESQIDQDRRDEGQAEASPDAEVPSGTPGASDNDDSGGSGG